MKNLTRAFAFVFLNLLFAACGNNNNVSPICGVGYVASGQTCVASQGAIGTGYNSAYGNCASGQINTALGCLSPGGPCTQGMGWDPKYNQCYPPVGAMPTSYYGAVQNYGNPYGVGASYGAYVGASATFGAAVGLPPSGQGAALNGCANGYAPSAQGCIPRCIYNYNGGRCVNY